MGTDKASLEFRGRRLVDGMFDLLGGLDGIGEVVVSGRIEGLPSIVDERRGLGPLEGVRSALKQLGLRPVEYERYLIVPVDMPLLDRESLAKLLAADVPGDAAAVRFRECELPLLINHERDVLRRLTDLCSEATPERRRSFKSWLGEFKVAELPRPERNLLNTNTPDEWREATR